MIQVLHHISNSVFLLGYSGFSRSRRVQLGRQPTRSNVNPTAGVQVSGSTYDALPTTCLRHRVGVFSLHVKRHKYSYLTLRSIMPSRDHKLSPSWPKYIENSYPRACHHRLCPVQGTYYLADPEHPTIPFTNAAIRSFAGATSAMATSVITCPLDVVKTKLQGRGGLQLWTLDSVSRRRSFQDRGLIGTGRAIWHQEGLAGMYQGLGPTMLANLPRGAIYFTVYHQIKNSMVGIYGNLPRLCTLSQ